MLMNQQHASMNTAHQRRAGVRRTAWIMAAVAVAVFVLFVIKQGLWH